LKCWADLSVGCQQFVRDKWHSFRVGGFVLNEEFNLDVEGEDFNLDVEDLQELYSLPANLFSV